MSKGTKQRILSAGAMVASRSGQNYLTMTRASVATQARVSEGRITQLFTDMPTFRTAVLQYALDTQKHRIVLQGIASGDTIMRGQSVEVREAALIHGSRR